MEHCSERSTYFTNKQKRESFRAQGGKFEEKRLLWRGGKGGVGYNSRREDKQCGGGKGKVQPV